MELNDAIDKLKELMFRHCAYGYMNDFNSIISTIEKSNFLNLKFGYLLAVYHLTHLKEIINITIDTVHNDNIQDEIIKAFDVIKNYLDGIILISTIE